MTRITMLLAAMVMLLGMGCAANVHEHQTVVRGTKALAKSKGMWKPGRRCRTIGVEKSPRVAVIVQRDCINAGVTSVAMVVFDQTPNGKAAAKEAVFMVKRILGYDPALAAMLVGEKYGTTFILSIVTGQSTATVASKE